MITSAFEHEAWALVFALLYTRLGGGSISHLYLWSIQRLHGYPSHFTKFNSACRSLYPRELDIAYLLAMPFTHLTAIVVSGERRHSPLVFCWPLWAHAKETSIRYRFWLTRMVYLATVGCKDEWAACAAGICCDRSLYIHVCRRSGFRTILRKRQANKTGYTAWCAHCLLIEQKQNVYMSSKLMGATSDVSMRNPRSINLQKSQ